MKKVYVIMVLMAMVLTSCKSSRYTDLGEGLFADIQTSKGDVVVRLEYDKTPITVANFVSLAEGTSPFVSDSLKGRKYYDGLIFHRVMKDFIIQGGDPLANGSGGPGYKFKNEINDSLHHSKAGILSMANTGQPVSNGSQFFITHKEASFLDGRHTVFGEVVKGMDVVDSIANVKTSPAITKDRPVEDIVMNSISIIRNGKAAKDFDAPQVMSDYFAQEEGRIAAMSKMKADLVAEFITQEEKATTLPSGLKIFKLKEGSGPKPKIGQTVLINHAGYLMDGSLFDSSYEEVAKKYDVFDEQRKAQGGYEAWPQVCSPDAQLIAGFKEGLLTMKVGDKVRLFIPSHLGYGAQGSRGVIPPNANLVFDLEITGMAE